MKFCKEKEKGTDGTRSGWFSFIVLLTPARLCWEKYGLRENKRSKWSDEIQIDEIRSPSSFLPVIG